jgi:hypothetical protein
MMKSKKTGLYITLLIFALFLLFLLIFAAVREKLNFSITTYFFLLVICDLAATAFLTIVLKSSAEYKGNVMKGNLSLTGSVVIFILILYVGYKFRPVESNDPFDLTFLIRTPTNRVARGRIMIDVNNERMTRPLNNDGQVIFNNISPNYLGKAIAVSDSIEGYKISTGNDTLITIPGTSNPVIKLTLLPVADSSLFVGFVHDWHENGSLLLPNVLVYFSKFNKTIQTDSLGKFEVYLPAKQGERIDLKIFQNKKMIYFNDAVLSDNMQIFIPKN